MLMHDPTPFDRGHQFRRRAPSFDIKIPLSSDNRSHHQQGLFYDTELDISANVPAVDRERNSARGASPASLRARSPSTEFTVARSFAEQKQMDLIESGEKSLGGKFRQLPCRTFIATGYCPYKDRCVYLHCPSVRTPYECKFKNKRKNKEDIVNDSLFWPIMPYASDHVENEYVVPLPQKDPYESHDRSLLSLWSFYTQACQRVQTEHSLHTLSGFEHAKAKRELAEGNNAGDPLNVVTKRNRLHVFHSLSNGEVPRKIASLPIPVVIDDLIPVPVVTPDRMSTGGVSNALCANSPSFTPVSQKHRLELEILSPPTSIKDKVSSPVSVSDIWNTTLQSLDDDSSMSAFNSPSFSRSVLSDDCEIAEESKNAAFVKRGYTEPCTYPSSMQEYSGASPLQSQHFKLPILCSANIMKHNSVLKGYVCEAYSKSNNFESLSESITLLSHTHAVDTAVMSADLHDHKLDLELQLDLTYMDSDDEAEEELYGIQQLSKGFMSPLSFEDSISSRTHSSTSTTLSAVNNGPDDDDDDDDCLGSEMSFGSFNFFKSHRQAITRSPTMRDLNAFGSLTIKDCSSSMPELPPSL